MIHLKKKKRIKTPALLDLYLGSYIVLYYTSLLLCGNRLSDESGTMSFSLVSEGNISKSMFDSKDGKRSVIWRCRILQVHHPIIAFIFDTGKELFVWIGKGASSDEKKNAMTYAHVRIRNRVHCVICMLTELSDEDQTPSDTSVLFEGGIRDPAI